MSSGEIEVRLTQLAEPLLIEVGYNAMTELGKNSSIIRRVTH